MAAFVNKTEMKSFSKMSFLRRIQKETLKLIEEKILLIGTFEAAADSLIKYNKIKYKYNV